MTLNMPEKNSFVVLAMPGESTAMRSCSGRLHSYSNNNGVVTWRVITGPTEMITCQTPPWKFLHVHHQPEEADDSMQWRAVRKAIGKAMRNQPKQKEMT